MTDTKQPEALRLAQFTLDRQTHLGAAKWKCDEDDQAAWDDYTKTADLLRRQHARIVDLESENRALSADLKAAQADVQIIQDRHDKEMEAIGAGGVTGLRDAPDKTLWCVHVYGPDDLLAMPSRAVALEEANGLNAAYARTEWDEHTPIMTATVEPWPYSPDGHAVEVAEAQRAAIAQEGGK